MRWLSNLWWRLIRFGFRLLYFELAFTYDKVSWLASRGQWGCWQRAALQFLPEPDAGTVLEIAHGTGNVQLDLYRYGFRAIGMDLSPFMVRIARRKLRAAGIPAKLTLCRAQDLPFPNSCFRCVLMTFPTSFISESRVLDEIHRVTQLDGDLIVVLSGAFQHNGMLNRLLEWLYRITGQRIKETRGQAGYEGLLEQLDSAGFPGELHQTECGGSQVLLFIGRKILLPIARGA